jgi:hypothetical protein
MKIVTYESGITDPPAEVPASACVEEMPETARECDILPTGTPCDDGNVETTDDKCISRAADAQCAGVVAIVSSLMFEAPVENLALPDATATPEEINSSPAAEAIKAALLTELAPAFGQDATITIIGIAAGSLIVDYRIEVPVEEATADNRDAALDTLSDGLSTNVELPGQDGTAVQLPDPIPAPLVSYAYSFTAAICTVTCSNDCGQAAIARSDIYTCLVDGIPGALSACHQALGPPPETRTTCCPAADPDTCRAPMPILSASFNRNQGAEELPPPSDDETDDETGDFRSPTKVSSGAVAAPIGLLAASALLGAI